MRAVDEFEPLLDTLPSPLSPLLETPATNPAYWLYICFQGILFFTCDGRYPMLRFGIGSLARIALLVIGALIVVDWLSTEEETENKSSEKTDDDKGKEEDAKAKDAKAKVDEGKDVEGEAVVED